MVVMQKASLEDAVKLLVVQYESFIVYAEKYGDFDSNPYHMTLERMHFNIKYRFGQYYKLVDDETNEIVGGLFAFELDKSNIMKIAQFYLKDKYRSLGYGQTIINQMIKMNPQVDIWYVDTILQEEYNVEFYKKVGFEVIDEEEEHEGLTFVTLVKKIKKEENNKILYLAGGCFWGIEKYFQMVKGIVDTDCGYANGNIENPAYEQLKSGEATHAETVKLTYDSRKISLRDILEHYFELVNPFTVNEQGIDKGIQYRSIVLYRNEEEKEAMEKFFNEMQQYFEEKIMVSIEPLKNYYSAEEYHQDYYDKHPDKIETCLMFKKQ